MVKNDFPAELLDSVTAISEPSFAIENCADYVACTNKGYLIEIKRNIIVLNVYVTIIDAVDLFCYYHWVGSQINYYYIVRGASGLLVVIHKEANGSKIILKREGVRNIRLQDLENCGQPKIILNGNLNDSNDSPEVLSIPINNPLVDIDNYDLNNQALSPILSKTLQDMQLKYDALAKENQMKNWLMLQQLEGRLHSGLEEVLQPSAAAAATPMPTPPPLIISSHYSKFSSLFWVVLLQIENISDRCFGVDDLQVFPVEHYSDELSWQIFTGGFPTQQLLPSSKNFMTILARLPVFGKEKGIAEFEIRYDNRILKTTKFTLMAKDVASGALDLFKVLKDSSMDLICLKATHFYCLCSLKVSAPVLTQLYTQLHTEMGLTIFGICDNVTNYLGVSSLFLGIFITFYHHSHESQQLKIHAKNSLQADIFLEAFKSCLPDGTALEIMKIETPCLPSELII